MRAAPATHRLAQGSGPNLGQVESTQLVQEVLPRPQQLTLAVDRSQLTEWRGVLVAASPGIRATSNVTLLSAPYSVLGTVSMACFVLQRL